ncbi:MULTISPECIES: hypothetical protein [unclassified Haladaptatus]|uniref:hypothetical protein n=1 Tax=unclassified Haladaptatus TaxID=2622732 RepID=UPI002FCE5FD3
MRKRLDTATLSVADVVPPAWDGDVEITRESETAYLVRQVADDGTVPPSYLPAGERPILVDVHYGRSAIARDRIEAIRYGFQESDIYTEFYYLQLIEEPEWVQITEESAEHDLAIVSNLDDWVADGLLTEAEAEWADDQFD